MPCDRTGVVAGVSKDLDIAIIGGGPGGSTCGGMLRRYDPSLKVGIFEREVFPREHVGESQLPPISKILRELGCWDQVEAAGFPIKIGATYRWGRSEQLWDFEFIPIDSYREEPRPREWSGQARQLALQVDRARYDEILLNHAARLGCRVQQPVQVRAVRCSGDQVDGLILADGREIRARWYVDASGASGVLRRALGVGVDVPTKLQNIAFWDYWENAEWATRYPGGATRVLVLSIGSGWIWFIPLGVTRTSIGFVCPRDFYRDCSKKPEEIYLWALQQESIIRRLTATASRSGTVRATRDWSFVAERAAGDNWLLVGEAAGFADPILAAGMTLAQTSGREAAYTLIALANGAEDPQWLKTHYEQNQRTRIRQHIRFADFWYSANGVFTDLQEYTREIARDAGLDLDPQKAFQWLGTGGFTHDVLGQVGIGGLDLAGTRQVAQRFVGGRADWQLSRCNRLFLKLDGTEEADIPAYESGQVLRIRSLRRGDRRLPVCGLFAIVIAVLQQGPDLVGQILPRLQEHAAQQRQMAPQLLLHHLLQALELMLNEGWVRGEHDPTRPSLDLHTPDEGLIIHTNRELNRGAAGP
jgi:flavin-dependent dehydrogenase